jgi:HAMP domain.
MAETISAGRDKPYTVVVAQDVLHHELFMSKFESVLAIAITLAAFATACLGWIATRWGLSPVREVTDMVAGISAERLSDRLPTTGLPPELKPLAAAFNAMLTAWMTHSDASASFLPTSRTNCAPLFPI